MPIKMIMNLFSSKPKLGAEEAAKLTESFLKAEAASLEKLQAGDRSGAIERAINASQKMARMKEGRVKEPPGPLGESPKLPPPTPGKPDWKRVCDKELRRFADLIRADYARQSHFERVAQSYLGSVERREEAEAAEAQWQSNLARWIDTLRDMTPRQYDLAELAGELGLEDPDRHTPERRALVDVLTDTGWRMNQFGERVLWQHPGKN